MVAPASIDPATAGRCRGALFAPIALAMGGVCFGCAGVLGIDGGVADGDAGTDAAAVDSGDASPEAQASAGDGPVTAADSGCASGQKSCGGACVNVADPSYGCTATGCGACSPVTNATLTCVGAVCGHACEQGYVDCAGQLCSCGGGNLCLSDNTCAPCRGKLQACQVSGDCCSRNCGGTLTCL
jgi:hypothetical protein